MDWISQLEGVPHVLEKIFFYLDTATVLETVKVSTTWKRLITRHVLRKRPWKNIQRISKYGWKDLNFQTLLKVTKFDLDRNRIHNDFKVNDKYVFIVDKRKIRIYNRWTRQLIKDFVFPSKMVLDMQLNERFLVVHERTDDKNQIYVYDVQKLEHIQTIETENVDFFEFALGSDILFIYTWPWPREHWMFQVHRWNPSTARFVRDTETEVRLKVNILSSLRDIYVDDKYVIFNFKIGKDRRRLVQVYSLETMQLVRERQFDFLGTNWKEYHDGGIVVRTKTADGQPCVALWDVDKDTVKPMTDHPIRFDGSFAMAHPPFQIVISESRRLLLVTRDQPIGNSLIAMPSLDDHSELIYFDGLQVLAIKKQDIDREWTCSINEWEIMVADLNG